MDAQPAGSTSYARDLTAMEPAMDTKEKHEWSEGKKLGVREFGVR